jgi:hypothetical protein
LSNVGGDTLWISQEVYEYYWDGDLGNPEGNITGLGCGWSFHYGGACAECDTYKHPTEDSGARTADLPGLPGGSEGPERNLLRTGSHSLGGRQGSRGDFERPANAPARVTWLERPSEDLDKRRRLSKDSAVEVSSRKRRLACAAR